jgi:Saxitoxin biosynthesis operon protein SxtJ
VKTSSSTEFTVRDGRRFGVQVGIAFLVLGAFLVWRDRSVPSAVAGSIGALLLLGGLLRPAALGPVYRRWMAIALLISKVTTPIFMGVVYFLVLTPTGLLMRVIGRNPIVHASNEDGGYWIRREPGKHSDMRRQF